MCLSSKVLQVAVLAFLLTFFVTADCIAAESAPVVHPILSGDPTTYIRQHIYKIPDGQKTEQFLEAYVSAIFPRMAKKTSTLDIQEMRLMAADGLYWLGRYYQQDGNDTMAHSAFRMSHRYYQASTIRTSIALNNLIGEFAASYQITKHEKALSPDGMTRIDPELMDEDLIEYEHLVRVAAVNAQRGNAAVAIQRDELNLLEPEVYALRLSVYQAKAKAILSNDDCDITLRSSFKIE